MPQGSVHAAHEHVDQTLRVCQDRGRRGKVPSHGPEGCELRRVAVDGALVPKCLVSTDDEYFRFVVKVHDHLRARREYSSHGGPLRPATCAQLTLVQQCSVLAERVQLQLGCVVDICGHTTLVMWHGV